MFSYDGALLEESMDNNGVSPNELMVVPSTPLHPLNRKLSIPSDSRNTAINKKRRIHFSPLTEIDTGQEDPAANLAKLLNPALLKDLGSGLKIEARLAETFRSQTAPAEQN